ncbi:hypothetical protein, partial [Kistimonas scapharcae]|uniref:hypothetical protein n=1 Tax=Kistimonas scapharcae TaxID=1036133 RepID=UPI0031EDD91F
QAVANREAVAHEGDSVRVVPVQQEIEEREQAQRQAWEDEVASTPGLADDPGTVNPDTIEQDTVDQDEYVPPQQTELLVEQPEQTAVALEPQQQDTTEQSDDGQGESVPASDSGGTGVVGEADERTRGVGGARGSETNTTNSKNTGVDSQPRNDGGRSSRSADNTRERQADIRPDYGAIEKTKRIQEQVAFIEDEVRASLEQAKAALFSNSDVVRRGEFTRARGKLMRRGFTKTEAEIAIVYTFLKEHWGKYDASQEAADTVSESALGREAEFDDGIQLTEASEQSTLDAFRGELKNVSAQYKKEAEHELAALHHIYPTHQAEIVTRETRQGNKTVKTYGLQPKVPELGGKTYAGIRTFDSEPLARMNANYRNREYPD